MARKRNTQKKVFAFHGSQMGVIMSSIFRRKKKKNK